MQHARSATFLAIAVWSVLVLLLILSQRVYHPLPGPRITSEYGYGYILELHASDQLTSGAGNVLCLQCLARQIHPRVALVEPFVTPTNTYGVSLVGDQELFARENNVKLSDIYDISDWKNVTQQRQFAVLATWEEFLNNAPRDVILVQNLFHEECSHLVRLNETLSPFFEMFRFQVVKLVCFQPKIYGPLTLNQFKVALYGNYSPPAVTVIFDRFCGIGTGLWPYGTALTGTTCEKSKVGRIVYSLKPSPRILKDAATYVKRYLGGDSNYISVMIRSAHSVIALRFNTTSVTRLLNKCFRQVVEEWKAMKSRVGSNATYVTYDNYSARKIGSVLTPLVKNFTQVLCGNENSLDLLESRFEDVAGLNHTGGIAGYMNIFQKVVATQARCLIQFGGGSFQESAFRLYTKFHKQGGLCYKRWDKYCS